MTNPAEIARKLKEAQKLVILRGYRMTDRFATVANLCQKGLMARRVCYPDGDGLPLTDPGLAVRAILEEQKDA